MNRTLLLIICDFLLISILALVDFEPTQTQENPAAEMEQRAQQGAESDLVEVLRLSLEDEAENRQQLQRELQEREAALARTAETLASREERLEMTEAERQRLEALREQLEEEKQALAATYEQAEVQLTRTLSEREQLASELENRAERNRILQEELQKRQQALEQTEAQRQELARQREELERERQRLATDLRIVETERAMLEQNLVAARAEREKTEIEKVQAQEQATRLAEGVQQLAQSSTELTEEIRQSQPKSLNAIFTDFRDNQVTVEYTFSREGLFGARDRTEAIQTILVRHSGQVYAVFGVSGTPFEPSTLNWLQSARANMRLGSRRLQVVEMSFLATDPRIAVVRVPGEFVEGSGIKVFNLDPDPLRFPEAVLIANRTGYYGETSFKLNAQRPEYLEMQTRLFNRLFGEFSPSEGDFVFSKSGELMGIMVDNSRALQLSALRPAEALNLGDSFSADSADRLADRLQRRIPAP